MCCRNIGHIPELKEFNRGDGVCKYLDEYSNLCKIYYKRPDICKVDLMYQKKYYKFYTKEQFFELNYKNCEFLKKEK